MGYTMYSILYISRNTVCLPWRRIFETSEQRDRFIAMPSVLTVSKLHIEIM